MKCHSNFHILIPAERIELQIGDTPPEEDVTLTSAQFSQLGYINLSENNHTEHRARELKSVNVNCTGSFLKLLLHKNHGNKLNKYNQVSQRLPKYRNNLCISKCKYDEFVR